MSYNTSVVRRLFLEAFGEEAFVIFCFDHALEIQRQFTTGQSQVARVQMLIEYALAQGMMGEILQQVKQHNPWKYAELASQLITESSVSGGNSSTIHQTLAIIEQRRGIVQRDRARRNSLSARSQKRDNVTFTGRETELQAFTRSIQALKVDQDPEDDVKLIFNIYGQGGAGKTMLIGQFERICRSEGVKVEIIDAKRKVSEQFIDVIDLLRELRSRFVVTRYQTLTQSNPFSAFDQAERHYKQLEVKVRQQQARESTPREPGLTKRTQSSFTLQGREQSTEDANSSGVFIHQEMLYESSYEPLSTVQSRREWLVATLGNVDDALFMQHAEANLIQTFAAGLEEFLDEEPFVLIIDTYEELEAIDSAIREQLLFEIKANLTIVLAGRHNLYDRFSNYWRDETYFFALSSFSISEVQEHLRKSKLYDAELAEAIYTLTQGWPLAVGIAIGMIRQVDDPTATMALFQTDRPLVGQPEAAQLQDIINEVVERFLSQVPQRELAVIWSAMIPERFDAEIVRAISGERTLSVRRYQQLLTYSFVFATADMYTIHDRVRSYTLRHLKRRHPQQYKELQERAATYYRNKFIPLQAHLTHTTGVVRGSQLSMIYHELQADERHGVGQLFTCIVEVVDMHDYGNAHQLLQLARRYPPIESLDVENLAQAYAALKVGNEELACQLLESDLAQQQMPLSQRFVTALTLGMVRLGWPFQNYKIALQHFRTAREALDEHPCADWQAINLLRQSDCYGYIQRWDEARQCALDALNYAKQSEQATLIAQCRIQLARVARSQGDLQQALEVLKAVHQQEQPLSEMLRIEVREEFGKIHQERGDHKEAIKWFKRACELAAQIDQPERVIQTWQLLGQAFRDGKDLVAAQNSFDRAQQIAEEAGNSSLVARIGIDIGRTHLDQGAFAVAIDVLNQSLTTYNQLGQEAAVADLWNTIGNTYRVWGKFDEALVAYAEAHQRYNAQEQLNALANLADNRGDTYRGRGDYQRAVTYYQEALQRYTNLKQPLDIANLWNTLAINYREWGKQDAAVEHYLAAKRRYEELERPADVANILLGLGLSALAQGQYAQAIDWLTQSRDRYVQLDRPTNVASLWDSLGDTYREWGKQDAAVEHYLEAKRRYEELERPSDVADELLGLAFVSRDLSDFVSAYQRLEESRALYEQQKQQHKVAQLIGRLGELALRQKVFDQALAYADEALSLSRQLAVNGPIVRALLCRGRALIQQQELVSAEESLNESLDLLAEMDSLEWSADAYIALGQIAWLRGDTVAAESHFATALAPFNERFFPRDQGDAIRELGEVYLTLGEREKAVAQLSKARDMYAQLDVAYLVERLNAQIAELARPADELSGAAE